MRPLASLERFFERLFEGQSARLFHTKLQPIQLQRRVERAMESGRVRDGDRTSVPHRFAVHLNEADLAALREAHPTLAADLADAALEFARSHHYRLADRPTVALVADVAIEAGDVVVAAAAESEHANDAAVAAPTGNRPAGEQTAVFVVPTVDAPRARLREVRPDGSSRTFSVDGRPLTIGRAPDNGLVLFDGRVSRHHARLYGRRGALLLADLGSTNGSWVNDRRVEEMALGEGDQIRVGDTILVVESFEDA
jgi:Protein of unknown function (DUF3662)/Inner membrane component of T3SS, cytoplasmic domain